MTMPVMKTFLPQPQSWKEKKTQAMQADLAPSPTSMESKLVHRSVWNKENQSSSSALSFDAQYTLLHEILATF